MAASLTTASRLQCPHGGTVGVTSSTSASAAGATVVVATDSFTVTGCAFTLPGPKPSPCARVEWVVTDQRVRLAGAPTLSSASVGLCLSADSVPQGPVSVVATQPRVVTS